MKRILFNVFEKVYDNGYEEFGIWKQHVEDLGIKPMTVRKSFSV
jgi:hypothetical protein